MSKGLINKYLDLMEADPKASKSYKKDALELDQGAMILKETEYGDKIARRLIGAKVGDTWVVANNRYARNKSEMTLRRLLKERYNLEEKDILSLELRAQIREDPISDPMSENHRTSYMTYSWAVASPLMSIVSDMADQYSRILKEQAAQADTIAAHKRNRDEAVQRFTSLKNSLDTAETDFMQETYDLAIAGASTEFSPIQKYVSLAINVQQKTVELNDRLKRYGEHGKILDERKALIEKVAKAIEKEIN